VGRIRRSNQSSITTLVYYLIKTSINYIPVSGVVVVVIVW
jgi:hypothetical protein